MDITSKEVGEIIDETVYKEPWPCLLCYQHLTRRGPSLAVKLRGRGSRNHTPCITFASNACDGFDNDGTAATAMSRALWASCNKLSLHDAPKKEEGKSQERLLH